MRIRQQMFCTKEIVDPLVGARGIGYMIKMIDGRLSEAEVVTSFRSSWLSDRNLSPSHRIDNIIV